MQKDNMEYFLCKVKEHYCINLNDIPEEEREDYIVELARQGDCYAIEYIFERYRRFVYSKAKDYFLVGADKEDLIQEGMIGLHKAIRDFDREKNVLFRHFADLCIGRQLITAVKGSTRQKHIPLNSYVSLNKPVFEEESDRTLIDTLANTFISDPEEIILNREKNERFKKVIHEVLSPLEEEVIIMYLEGESYQQIAEKLDCNVKVIDNAIQRAKKKFEKCMEDGKMD